MSNIVFVKLMDFLDKLEQAKISYTLGRHRDEAIMVSVVVPGERWEIEFLLDGSVEVERFRSDGEIYNVKALDELFARYVEPGQEDKAGNVMTGAKVAEMIAEGE